MATDPGVVDAYLTVLKGEIDRRETELGQVTEQLKTAKLEDIALAALAPETASTLAAANVTGRLDCDALMQKRDQLRAEIDAIRDLRAAAKGAA